MSEITDQTLPADHAILLRMASSFIEDPKELGEGCTPMAHFFLLAVSHIKSLLLCFFNMIPSYVVDRLKHLNLVL